MMDVKKAKDAVLLLLELHLKKLGFNHNKNPVEFIRPTKTGWDRITIIFYEYPNELNITFSMGIRNEAIEKIYHKTSGFEKKYQSGTSTIGSFISDYLGSEMLSKIKTEKDIDNAVVKMAKIIEEHALSFFSKYQSITLMEQRLNESPLEYNVLKGFFPHKAHTATILGKIFNPSRYKHLTQLYTKELEDVSKGVYLDDYLNLLDDLEKNPPSVTSID